MQSESRYLGHLHSSPLSRQNDWLSQYAKNVTSQHGEDGIIEEVFTVIRDHHPTCVEIGAGDGKHLSNTWNLITHHGWSAVLVESDIHRYQQSIQTHAGNPRVVSVNCLGTFAGTNSLDTILARTNLPQTFGLLSLDIDGNDYHVWEALVSYRPCVVVVEYNPSIPNDIEFIQPKDMEVHQGSSLLALMRLAKRKKYELVATTALNAIFVDEQYYPRFGIQDNSLATMHCDHRYETRLFQLYDGTVVLAGCNRLLWHGITIEPPDIQILPRHWRKFVGHGIFRAPRIFRTLQRIRRWFYR